MTKVISGDDTIDGLLWTDDRFRDEVLSWHTFNSLGSGVTLTYSFLNSVPFDLRGDIDDFEVMTNRQREAVNSVLASIEAVADVRFVEISAVSDADISFGMADLNPFFPSTSGITYNYSAGFSQFGYFTDSYVFFTTDIPEIDFSNADPDTFAYMVILHEIGHALGLEHPFEGDVILDADLDTTRHTVMSYTDGFDQSQDPRTMMPLDIQALQYLYGANTSTNSGDTVYDLSAYDTGSIQTIWDAGGEDTVDLSGLTRQGPRGDSGLREHMVDLREGFDVGAKIYTSGGMILEHVIGSDFVDHIIGNSLSNTINAGGAADYVNAGSGDDSVFGEDGDDTLINPDGSALLNGGDGFDTLIAGNGNSTLLGGANADRLIGGRGADELNGGSGNDVIVGDLSTYFFGDDVLIGGGGSDLMMGGQGADTFVFDAADVTNAEIGKILLETDTIDGVDFEIGIDKVQLVGFDFASTADAYAQISDIGGRAVFEDADTTITFHGLTADMLSADDFILA